MKLSKWLNFAGVLNIIVAILMFMASRITIIPVVFLIISGFHYRSFFNKEGPYQRRESLQILGIFNLLFNFISGIIVLEVYSLIKKDENYSLNSNIKNNKINGLLQLGVILVLLAGVMIATNQTLVISSLVKVLGLLFLSIMFFFLSYVSRKYLKLESSFKTYFILGMSFILIGFIGLYYYELLGSMSYKGTNYLYFYPLLLLLITICSLITANVLKNDKFNYVACVSGLLILFTGFNALEVSLVINLLVCSIVISLFNFIYYPSCKLTENLNRVSNILSYVIIPINILVLIMNDFDLFSCLLAVLTSLNMFHIFVIKKDNLSACISLPTLIINSLIVVGKSAISEEIGIVFFQVMMIVFYYLIKFIELENINIGFKKINRILFNFVFILTGLVSIFISREASLIVTSLLLLQNVIGLFEKRKEEIFLEPIKSLLFIISLMLFINSRVEIDLMFNLFIVEIIELLLYFLIKNNILKKIHYIIYLILIGLMSIVSLINSEILLALIALVSAIIPLVISLLKKRENIAITIFTSIVLILINNNEVFTNIYYLNYLFTFIFMLAYAYIYRKNKYEKYIALFASSILCLSFIDIGVIDYYLYNSLNIFAFYYIGLLIASLINDKNSKDIFMMIYFGLLILFNIFTTSIWVFVTVSLVAISMVIFGFIKDFKKLKITAIILFILNLIYQLKDFWKDIPLAIYLLVIGLVLIGIVVVKEIKENKI